MSKGGWEKGVAGSSRNKCNVPAVEISLECPEKYADITGP